MTTKLRFGLLPCCLLIAGWADASEVNFATADPRIGGDVSSVRGLLAKPEGPGPFPAVVLLHTCGGVRAHVGRDWPEFFVKHGYVALTVDSFGSRGLGPCPNALSPPRPGSRIFPSGAMTSDAHGALDYLRNKSFVQSHQIAVMGFSLGGFAIHFSLLQSYARAKRTNAFKAAISLYGPCAVRKGVIRMRKLARSPVPLLEIIGEYDGRILRECKELLPSGPLTKLHVIAGAYHAFDNTRLTTMRRSSGGSQMLYSHAATQTARALVKEFLAKILGE